MLKMTQATMSHNSSRLSVICALTCLYAVAAAPPRIGLIEVYGLRRLSRARILQAAGVTEGGGLPKSKGTLEEAVEGVEGVLSASTEAFCCNEGRPVLYIGIQERGTPLYEYRAQPDEDVNLPEEAMAAYTGFAAALGRATGEGDLDEDLTAGHSMMRNAECRAYQERFLEIASKQLQAVRAVLARSAEADQRVAAAYIVMYAQEKRTVIGDLQSALRDPVPGVRNNAATALRAIAVLGRDKSLGIKIEATWLVEMLNSPVLPDRLTAARALHMMYEEFSEGTEAQIKERALDSLFEMARWKHLPHALPPYLILGRVAGIPEKETAAAWEAGEREQMLVRIGALLAPKKK